MFNIFNKRKNQKQTNEVAGVSYAKIERAEVKEAEIKHAKIERAEIKTVEPERSEPLVFKFKDTTTGEIHIVKFGDDEAFDKMMGNKNMALLIGF